MMAKKAILNMKKVVWLIAEEEVSLRRNAIDRIQILDLEE